MVSSWGFGFGFFFERCRSSKNFEVDYLLEIGFRLLGIVFFVDVLF